MIPLDRFLAAIAENAARVHEYQLGCDGSNGKCDCIGLIIGAVRLCGEKWPWTHGSNYTARKLLAGGIQKDAPLRLGDLVFKARAPGESGYALPDKYKQGGSYYNGDLLDYYHVGVVTRVDPLEITHCTSVPGGIKHDSTRGKWHYSGWLKLIEEGGEQPMQTAIVAAPSGKTVNLRSGPSERYNIVAQVPVGDTVNMYCECDDEWAEIGYNGTRGYMMRKFLKKIGEPNDGDTVAVTLDRNTAESLFTALKGALGE